MLSYNKIVGNYGETIACTFLKKNNYQIIKRNVQTSHKEIDIIAQINNELVFIEVKTRCSETLGKADEMLSVKKIRNLKKAIAIFLYSALAPSSKTFRLDFISIDINKKTKSAKIKHFKDII